MGASSYFIACWDKDGNPVWNIMDFGNGIIIEACKNHIHVYDSSYDEKKSVLVIYVGELTYKDIVFKVVPSHPQDGIFYHIRSTEKALIGLNIMGYDIKKDEYVGISKETLDNFRKWFDEEQKGYLKQIKLEPVYIFNQGSVAILEALGYKVREESIEEWFGDEDLRKTVSEPLLD